MSERHAVTPSIVDLFPALRARDAMRAAMKESLDALKAQQYTWELVKESTKPIADLCRERLKGALIGGAVSASLAACPPLLTRSTPLPPPPFAATAAAALSTPRYKLFVQVTLAESKGQGVRVASRMLWDTSSDVMAAETYACDLPGKDGEVVSIVASATVHAVYMP